MGDELMTDLREESLRVRMLRDHIARLRSVLEEAFSALASTLPTLSQDLDDLSSALGAREVEESAAMLSTALEALRGADKVLSEQRGNVISANRNASELLAALGRNVEEVGIPITGALNLTEGLTAAVLLQAPDSLLAARRSLPAMPSILPQRALEAFSERSRRVVPALHQTVASLRQLSRQLLDTRTEFGNRAAQLASLTGRVGHSLDAAAADLTALRDAIRRAHKCIVRSSELVSAVMVGIQRQDIIRQKLENMLLALMELDAVHREMSLRGEEGSRLAFTIQRQIAQMSARLVDDVQCDLDALLADVSKSLGSLAETAEALAALRSFAPDLRRLRTRIASPVGALRDAQETVSRLDEIAAEHADLGRRLPDLGEDLAINLTMLDEATRALSDLQSSARSWSRGPSASTSSTGSRRLVQRMRQEFATLMGTVGNRFTSMKDRGVALAEIAQRVRMDAESARRLESATEKATALRNAAVALMDRFERALLVGSALGGEAQRFLMVLGAVRSASKQGIRAVAECTALVDRADMALAGLRPHESDESIQREARERLQRLVERFTVLSHKAIGRDVSDLAAGRGDAPGTLTFF